MNYSESMNALEQEGFLWQRLRDYFPFGAVDLREGNYERLLKACLERLPEEEDKERLLDLLDMQAVVFLEQCWVQDEMASKHGQSDASDLGDDMGQFGMSAHFAAAWLQINSNHSGLLGARRQSLAHILRSLPDGSSLRQVLCQQAESAKEVL